MIGCTISPNSLMHTLVPVQNELSWKEAGKATVFEKSMEAIRQSDG